MEDAAAPFLPERLTGTALLAVVFCNSETNIHCKILYTSVDSY